LQTHIPVRKYTRRGVVINHTDYLLRISKRLKLVVDFEIYNTFRNHLTHVKELYKRKYYKDQFAKTSKNLKRISMLILSTF